MTSRPRRDDVRAAILDAALKRFSGHGYEQTSLAAVAADAGFTKGAIYSNFGGKPELFAAVAGELVAATGTDLVWRAMEARNTGSAATGTVAVAMASAIVEVAPMQLALAEFRRLATQDETIRATYGAMRDGQRRTLAERLAGAGLVPATEAPVVAVMLLALVNQLCLEHAADPGTTPESLIRQTLTRSLEGLL